MLIDINDEHPENVPYWISVTPDGIMIDVSDEHSLNAECPIHVKPDGI